MKSLIISIAVGTAAGLVCWAFTATIGLLPLPWSVLIILAAAAIVFIIALLLSRRIAPASTTDRSTRVVHGLRSDAAVGVKGVTVHTQNRPGDAEIVKDIRARGDITISDIETD